MKEKHPPIYYTTRSVVRTVVWGGLALGLLLGVVSHFSDKRPLCDIRIESASPPRWVSTSATPVDVTKCIAPAYMVLNPDGSWRWVDDK